MANQSVEDFLDLYKRLEQLLKSYYGNDNGHYESVVARFENSRAAGKQKDAIKAIREIRNLIQHSPKIAGKYIVEPSDEIMKELCQVIQSLEHPRLAIDFGVRESHIYKTYTDYSLLKVFHVMKERGFSHVPVLENGKFFGVLSAYTVFEFVAQLGMTVLSETTKVNAMRDYLPIEKHRNEYYLFMPRTTTFYDAVEAFVKRDNKGRRLVVIFITENGRPDEQILSMLTPWSVVGK